MMQVSQTPRGEPHYRLHTAKGISVNLQEQDKSSDKWVIFLSHVLHLLSEISLFHKLIYDIAPGTFLL